jgi:uncharacterized glyoxalase superfamily protein PhnB
VFSRFVYLQAYQQGVETAAPLLAYVTFYRGQAKAYETAAPGARDAMNNRLKTMPLNSVFTSKSWQAGEYLCHVTVIDAAGGNAAFWQGAGDDRSVRRVADYTEVKEEADVPTEAMSPTGEENRIHELFAYLCVRNAAAAIDFYRDVFGAREKFRLTEPGGRIGHAELDFGGVTVMLAGEFPECGFTAPDPARGVSMLIHLHVDNADAMIERAVRAGAAIEIPIKDQFYGERSGSIRDPFGHRWNIGHSIEAVSPEEMQQRYDRELAGA